MRRRRLLYLLLLPGIVLHELAHAFTILLLPGISIDEIKLTSHVKHSGRYTVTRSFLISYAPLAVNTGVALLAAYYLTQLAPTSSITALLAVCTLCYLSIVTAFTAFPSYQNAINPVRMLRAQFSTRRVVLLLPAAPIILVLATPGIVLSYLFRAFPLVRLLLGGLYAVAIVLTGVGAIHPDQLLLEIILETDFSVGCSTDLPNS